uniref:Uncharacterized protein n=1 Tax=Oryza glumipatula TaxID=40148 RepID=A0A0E0AJN1_9ORYZ
MLYQFFLHGLSCHWYHAKPYHPMSTFWFFSPLSKQNQLRVFHMGKYEPEAPIATVEDPISSHDKLENTEMVASLEMLGNMTDKPLAPLEMLPKVKLSVETPPAPMSPPMRFGNGGCHIDLNDQPPEVEKLVDETLKISGEEIKANMELPAPVSPPRSFGTGGCGCDLNEMPEDNDEGLAPELKGTKDSPRIGRAHHVAQLPPEQGRSNGCQTEAARGLVDRGCQSGWGDTCHHGEDSSIMPFSTGRLANYLSLRTTAEESDWTSQRQSALAGGGGVGVAISPRVEDGKFGPMGGLGQGPETLRTSIPCRQMSPPMRFGNSGCHIDLNDQPPVEEKLAAEAVKISGEEKMLIKADKEYPTPPVSPPRSFGTGTFYLSLFSERARRRAGGSSARRRADNGDGLARQGGAVRRRRRRRVGDGSDSRCKEEQRRGGKGPVAVWLVSVRRSGKEKEGWRRRRQLTEEEHQRVGGWRQIGSSPPLQSRRRQWLYDEEEGRWLGGDSDDHCASKGNVQRRRPRGKSDVDSL